MRSQSPQGNPRACHKVVLSCRLAEKAEYFQNMHLETRLEPGQGWGKMPPMPAERNKPTKPPHDEIIHRFKSWTL